MHILLSIYYALPNWERKSLLYKALSRGIARMIKLILDSYVPYYFSKTAQNQEYRINGSQLQQKEQREWVIASLTSFPARITHTHISIECLFRQSVLPDKIILWLAKEQFPKGLEDLPESLLNMQERGLEIRFCEDIRSHKKYYYTLSNYPDSKLIMFDDDIYFHRDMIKSLLHYHRRYPGCVIASRAHKMLFDQGGQLLPYKNWLHNYVADKPDLYLLHTSGNGTLIPGKQVFDEVCFDKALIMQLSPNSDDVWLKVHLIRNNVPVFVFGDYAKDPITVKSTQQSSLVSHNTFNMGKDTQFRNCVAHFGILKKPSHIAGILPENEKTCQKNS